MLTHVHLHPCVTPNPMTLAQSGLAHPLGKLPVAGRTPPSMDHNVTSSPIKTSGVVVNPPGTPHFCGRPYAPMAVGLSNGRHAADEEARAEVDVLNSRLEKTTQLTKKIQASLSRLEATGKSVREVAGPLNGETKKLQTLTHSRFPMPITLQTPTDHAMRHRHRRGPRSHRTITATRRQ